ncbi:hypothetical protein [Specibacter sp. NPDC078692]|uniref:hypothetical protein n=1 Tax=Specibacter sp. NPDC078692 TaxID=3155818 RepID=UPI0034489D68
MALKLKRPQKNVDLCLDGTLRSAWQEADARLALLRKQRFGDDRLNSPVKALAQEVIDLQEQMKAETVTFTIQGLPRTEWADLITENPERDDTPTDKSYGFNATAVAGKSIPASIVSATQNGEPVEFNAATDWDALADEMTDQQYEEFFIAVLNVNRGRLDIPFSTNASLEMRPSAES